MGPSIASPVEPLLSMMLRLLTLLLVPSLTCGFSSSHATAHPRHRTLLRPAIPSRTAPPAILMQAPERPDAFKGVGEALKENERTLVQVGYVLAMAFLGFAGNSQVETEQFGPLAGLRDVLIRPIMYHDEPTTQYFWGNWHDMQHYHPSSPLAAVVIGAAVFSFFWGLFGPLLFGAKEDRSTTSTPPLEIQKEEQLALKSEAQKPVKKYTVSIDVKM